MLLLVVVGVFLLVGRWCCPLFVMLCRCLMSVVCSFGFSLGVVSCCLLFVVFG